MQARVSNLITRDMQTYPESRSEIFDLEFILVVIECYHRMPLVYAFILQHVYKQGLVNHPIQQTSLSQPCKMKPYY